MPDHLPPAEAYLENPGQREYRWPAEWEPHQATWVSWPHNPGTWPGRVPVIERVFAELMGIIAESEDVHVNVNDQRMLDQACDLCTRAGVSGGVHFHCIPTNDAWCRDHGAIFVQRLPAASPSLPPLLALDWGFNAWGEKYPPWDLDDAVPRQMAAALGVPLVAGGMVLEGGSIETNGAGTLLTTESCLLNENRNPHLTMDQIEARLRRMLGTQRVLWLLAGIAGDDTDGHIDDITRFTSGRTVLTMIAEDPSDPNHRPLAENLRRLRHMRTPDGQPLEIVTLPMPHPVIVEGSPVPASYANYYLTNKHVIVPLFRQPRDREACSVLENLFPSRTVVGIDCVDIVSGLGGFHCLTQQVPVAVATLEERTGS